jgi:hypothetical protein
VLEVLASYPNVERFLKFFELFAGLERLAYEKPRMELPRRMR